MEPRSYFGQPAAVFRRSPATLPTRCVSMVSEPSSEVKASSASSRSEQQLIKSILVPAEVRSVIQKVSPLISICACDDRIQEVGQGSRSRGDEEGWRARLLAEEEEWRARLHAEEEEWRARLRADDERWNSRIQALKKLMNSPLSVMNEEAPFEAPRASLPARAERSPSIVRGLLGRSPTVRPNSHGGSESSVAGFVDLSTESTHKQEPNSSKPMLIDLNIPQGNEYLKETSAALNSEAPYFASGGKSMDWLFPGCQDSQMSKVSNFGMKQENDLSNKVQESNSTGLTECCRKSAEGFSSGSNGEVLNNSTGTAFSCGDFNMVVESSLDQDHAVVDAAEILAGISLTQPPSSMKQLEVCSSELIGVSPAFRCAHPPSCYKTMYDCDEGEFKAPICGWSRWGKGNNNRMGKIEKMEGSMIGACQTWVTCPKCSMRGAPAGDVPVLIFYPGGGIEEVGMLNRVRIEEVSEEVKTDTLAYPWVRVVEITPLHKFLGSGNEAYIIAEVAGVLTSLFHSHIEAKYGIANLNGIFASIIISISLSIEVVSGDLVQALQEKLRDVLAISSMGEEQGSSSFPALIANTMDGLIEALLLLGASTDSNWLSIGEEMALIVDPGELKTGNSKSEQTNENASLIFAMGIKQMTCCYKQRDFHTPKYFKTMGKSLETCSSLAQHSGTCGVLVSSLGKDGTNENCHIAFNSSIVVKIFVIFDPGGEVKKLPLILTVSKGQMHMCLAPGHTIMKALACDVGWVNGSSDLQKVLAVIGCLQIIKATVIAIIVGTSLESCSCHAQVSYTGANTLRLFKVQPVSLETYNKRPLFGGYFERKIHEAVKEILVRNSE